MPENKKLIRVLVVGCGNMGASHAMAYHTIDGSEICGIVSTGKSKEVLNEKLGGGYSLYNDFEEALSNTKPDAVCISTYPDTHESFAIKALEKGCHVFIEKPLTDTVDGSERVAAAAKESREETGSGLYTASSSFMGTFYTTRTTIGQAVGDAYEPEPAKSWQYVERASQPDEKFKSYC